MMHPLPRERAVLRALTPADATALRLLWNRAAAFDPLTPTLLHEKVWADPAVSGDLVLGVADDDELLGFAVGLVRPAASAEGTARRGYVKLLAVAPGHQGHGLGRRLLTAVEGALWERGATEIRLGESAPNYLQPGIDVRYTSAWLLAEAAGYRKIGETYNLIAELTADAWATDVDEARLAQHGVVVRRARPEDRGGIEAFLDEHWPAWQAEVRTALGRSPAALHLALREATGAVLGFSAYDANNEGLGWFGPMGTAEAARGLGIGRVLLRRCLRDQRRQGHATAVIPWVGPIGFYARHAGARVDRVFWRYAKTRTAPAAA